MCYRVYKTAPFLWEMKVITDWIVTETCLDLFQWFRMEDATLYLFYNKYVADSRKKRYEFDAMGL